MVLWVLILVTPLLNPYVYANDNNVIRIEENEVIWLYSRNKKADEPKDTLKLLNLTLSPTSIHYHLKLLPYPSSPIKVYTSFALIGNERIYHQFTYENPNVSIMLDINLNMDRDNIIIYWFNIKTTKITTEPKSPYSYLLPRYIWLTKYINRTMSRLALPIFINYIGSMMVTVTDHNIVESINLYDVVVDWDSYIDYVKKELGVEAYNICSNMSPKSIYTWLEVNNTVFGETNSITISLNSININDVQNSVEILSCIVPLVKAIDMIIKNMDLDTYYVSTCLNYGIDIGKLIENQLQVYVLSRINHYINLAKRLTAEYNVVNPSIEVNYDTLRNGLRISVAISSSTSLRLNREEIRRVLIDMVKLLPVSAGRYDVDWDNILSEASIIDIRSDVTQYYTAPTILNDAAFILAFILAFIQTMVIISITIMVLVRKRMPMEKASKPM